MKQVLFNLARNFKVDILKLNNSQKFINTFFAHDLKYFEGYILSVLTRNVYKAFYEVIGILSRLVLDFQQIFQKYIF